MNCDRVESELLDLLSEESDNVSPEIRQHIENCPECKAKFESTATIVRGLENHCVKCMPFETEGRVLEAIRTQRKSRRFVGLRSWAFAGAVVVALLAAVIMWRCLYLSPVSPAGTPSSTGRQQANAGKLPAVPGSKIESANKNTSEPKVTAPGTGKRQPDGLHSPSTGTVNEKNTFASAKSGPTGNESSDIPQTKPRRQPLLTVIAARYPVMDRNGRRIEIGQRLAAGDLVQTGDNGRITLITRRGSQLDLDANSRMALSSDGTASLMMGRVHCSNRAHEIPVIDTPAGRIELLGTILDAAVLDESQVAVTVVEGKVEIINGHGKAVVDAGRKSVFDASLPPGEGTPVNTFAETAWCDRRSDVESDFGEITYTVTREPDLVTEVWVMNANGTDRRRVRSYIGTINGLGPWMPGQRWLLAETNSPGFLTPDYTIRRAVNGTNQEVLKNQKWFLNSVTGQDIPMSIPLRYKPFEMSFSPDGTRIAFAAEDHPERGNWANIQRGLFQYNVQTGQVTQLHDKLCLSTPAWTPDGRKIVATAGEYPPTSRNQPLVIVDTETLEKQNLQVQGFMPSLSPDGSKLAYCEAFMDSTSPTERKISGVSIFVLDLRTGSNPVQITPSEAMAIMPHWSPDGSQILYYQFDAGLRVVGADGTQVRQVCPEEFLKDGRVKFTVGFNPCMGWARSGDAVYLCRNDGVFLFGADGSGLKANLSQNSGQSELTPEEDSETDAAVKDLHEAFYCYAVGFVRAFEGRVIESRAAFQASADIFSELMWRHPLAGFGASDVLRYADKAAEMASRSEASVMSNHCWEHLRYIRAFISNWGDYKAVPSDLDTLEYWASTNKWQRIGWMTPADPEHVQMIFQCPASPLFAPTLYLYYPPADGVLPKDGDVLVTCQHHPWHWIEWGNRGTSYRYQGGPILKTGDPSERKGIPQ